MRKIYNFSAGPAMVPEEVLKQAQSELLDWQGTGMSIMELGHRTELFKEVADKAERDLRDLMQIPDTYKVLFLAGGASTQFAMVPLNLFGETKIANYVDTGIWSKKAIAEANRYGKAHVAAATIVENGLYKIPPISDWKILDDASYLHFTPNETIEGVQFHFTPEVKPPLVADMTSMILSTPIKVEDYGIIYAGAQKNIGFAGLNIVIIRDDLIKAPLEKTPTLYSYKVQADNHCFYNTPPTYNWYFAGLVFAWMKKHGGVEAFSAINKQKAEKIYACIDAFPGFYYSRVHPSCRSIMNVMFYLHDENLTPLFLEQAGLRGLEYLRGHRISGGIRASIYNAMPEEGVDRLVEFMHDFVKSTSKTSSHLASSL